MVDFFTISTRPTKRGCIEIYPKFLIKKSSDLMIRGGDFYAIWCEDRGLWSTDEGDALAIIDRELDRYAEANRQKFDANVRVMHMWDAETGMIDSWHKYCQKQCRDNYSMLDEKLIFSNTPTNKLDFASKRLNYPLEEGSIEAYDKLIGTLYSEEERHKLEWAIGSIVSGASKQLQKFMVLYGSAGTGKSTILNIIQSLFEGYYSVFDAKALGSSSNSFALEAFKTNPLVAIQHDGDLSRIEDNTRLNSLVSHELMTVNEKFKSTYANRFKAFLFMGTNKPVKITDAKSGLMRRLIDVSPTGVKVSAQEYKRLTKQIEFELGAIAKYCMDIYLDDPNYYDDYIPVTMLGASNDFFNYVEENYLVFNKAKKGIALQQAWDMYKVYCEEAKVSFPFNQRVFKEELKNYFEEYYDRFVAEDGTRIRSYYVGFKADKFDIEDAKKLKKDRPKIENKFEAPEWLFMQPQKSKFDILAADFPAQYASDEGTPFKKWANVTTVLKGTYTDRLHYVKVPVNHIVIDFDIPDKEGNKYLEANLKEAAKWPATYAELSKSGAGIHLHYIYTGGDPELLSRIYDEHIEIKVFTGDSSLRRKLTKCNNLDIANISSGLPMKGKKTMVNFEDTKDGAHLLNKVKKLLRKEYDGISSTSQCMSMIFETVEDAYKSGMVYDITPLRADIIAFAAKSTHNSDKCLQMANKMHYCSETEAEAIGDSEMPIVFYDVEVFPNLFLVNWKYEGIDNPVMRMINPTPDDMEKLMRFRLVGFNCRRYDNHIIYARYLGKTNEELYIQSQKIIDKSPNAFYKEAYNLSYTDIYDYAAKKQSLKKWEIELGIHHQELGLPWNEPVPEEMWEKVAEYCDNDVIATEAVWNATQADFTARKILADLAGMTPNDTTNSLSARVVFGKEKHPKLIYTDLATGEQY